MARRTRFPALLFAFAVAFGAGGAGAYVARTAQLRQHTALGTSVVTIPETTAAETTLLSVDSSTADTTIADTTVAPTTTTTEAPTTKAPTTTAATARSTPQLTSDGALLDPIADTDRRLWSDDAGCNSLARNGAADSCDRLDIGGVQVAWVIDAGGGSIDILKRDPATDGPDVWTVVLRSDSAPTRAPRVADVTGDGQPELVVGWRDSKGTLAVDVVEVRDGTPSVSLHLSLVDGRITVGDGQIDAWNGVPQPGDDPDKPSSFDHWTYTRNGGRWTVDAARDDNPPAGQL